MSDFRFIIDDCGQSETQRTILREYADQLRNGYDVKIVWASELNECSYWVDVPGESARRLGLRIMALRPSAGLQTVFLPGHIVPGELAPPRKIESDIALDNDTTLANLDLFVVDNGSGASRRLEELLNEINDYNTISEYRFDTSMELPPWLSAENLNSCLLLDDRPWYSAHSATRARWARLVTDLVRDNKLSLSTVRVDVQNGFIRPSSLVDIKALFDDKPLELLVPPTIDSVFVYPELELSQSRLRLLNSPELRARLISNTKSKKSKKPKIKKLKKSTLHSVLANVLWTGKKRVSKILGIAGKSLRRLLKSTYRHTRKFLYFLYKQSVATAGSVLKSFNRDK